MAWKPGVEGVVREMKRRTRRKYSSEEQIRIVLPAAGRRGRFTRGDEHRGALQEGRPACRRKGSKSGH